MPDGLWSFSLAMAWCGVWAESTRSVRFACCALACGLGAYWEVLQYVGWLQGEAGAGDLAFFVAGGADVMIIALKTGSKINVKGKISGVMMRNIELEPAIVSQ